MGESITVTPNSTVTKRIYLDDDYIAAGYEPFAIAGFNFGSNRLLPGHLSIEYSDTLGYSFYVNARNVDQENNATWSRASADAIGPTIRVAMTNTNKIAFWFEEAYRNDH